MQRTGSALLEFDPRLNALGKGKEIRHGLSVALQTGDSLWVANDETVSLERLTPTWGADGSLRFAGHRQYKLDAYLGLPLPAAAGKVEEADIEGIDCADGYLWLAGSHSRVRSKPKRKEPAAKGIARLAKVAAGGNRFLLARIPMVSEGPHWAPVKEDGGRVAARLAGDAEGNALTQALAGDEHLRDFLALPGKDNGFDIEGLAAQGERLLLGLRGPVLRGWAVILELRPRPVPGDASRLQLGAWGADPRPYRKRFLQIEGMGLRDLCIDGDDVLLLAGPTMDLDAPALVLRWRGGAHAPGDGLVFREELELLGSVPCGRGSDRAEGICVLEGGGRDRALLVVYDSADEARLPPDAASVTADLFALP